ncbi:TolC family protein [Caenimonas soli]|uniref:TolC family protein n=1 Tax=Caenimonas soli TaxID=2735555 RepID=UPI001F2E9F38|nr:TolC family protein [Caenimonas soli]
MLPRYFLVVTCAAALVPMPAVSQPMTHEAAPVVTESLTFDRALELAVQRSQSARAARASMASASQSARVAGQLPDPTLRAGIDNLPVTGPDRLSTTRDSMTMKRIGISQEWLSAEKRAARTAAAQALVSREEAQLKASVAEARLQTSLAYLDAFYAGEALKLAQLMQHHAREEFEASRARLASSSGSSSEVLALTGARAMAEDESTEIHQQQAAAQVALQRWSGVAAGELAAAPQMGGLSEEAFVEGHPSVLVKQQEVQVARLEAASTASNRRPNWTWEASYGQRSGYSDMVSVVVSIPLPVAPGERQNRETVAKLSLIDKAEADLAEARRAAHAEYETLVRNSHLLDERIERYREGVVLPAQQRVAAATASYRSNQGTLMTLFEARRAEVEAQRKQLTLQRDLAKTMAQLAYRAWWAPRDTQ